MKNTIYKILGVGLLILYIATVCIFIKSDTIKAVEYHNIYLLIFTAICLIVEIIFIVFGLKNKSAKRQMTVDFAKRLIVAELVLEAIAKVLYFIAIVLFVLGIGLNEKFTILSIMLWFFAFIIDRLPEKTKIYNDAQTCYKKYNKRYAGTPKQK